MTTNDSLSCLSDAELLIEVKRLAAIEREATADSIRSLAEVEARRLHLAIGCSSMFGYCTQVLHLSEHAAYARIAVARATTRFSVVMDLLIEGAITLTTVTLLGRHLTAENHARLLESARHKSKADVEMLVAAMHPRPDVPSSVRKVPAPNRQAGATAPLISGVGEGIAVPQATTHRSPRPRHCRRRPQWFEPSRPSATSCKSQSQRRPARSSAGRRICCGTRTGAPTKRQSSTAR
jgi:hypothetical protein